MRILALMIVGLMVVGCKISKNLHAKWGPRVGSFTYAQTISELGLPNCKDDNSTAVWHLDRKTQWSKRHGYNKRLSLAFDSGNILKEYRFDSYWKTSAEEEKKVKELTLEEKVIGTYEIKEGKTTTSMVFQYNDIGKIIVNGKAREEVNWKIVDKEVHVEDKGNGRFEVLRIESNGDLTFISVIVDGKRTDIPKEDQQTIKKSNNSMPKKKQ